MPRLRLAVVALVPPPVAAEVDGLRRAAGDRGLARIAAHITLVPPINLVDDDLGAALAVVRAAGAARSGPLELTLGPATTFDPPNSVAFLAVGGPGADGLAQLQAALVTGPFERPVTRPFVPHVTLNADLKPARRDAWLAAAADYRQDVVITHVHVLEQQATESGFRWHLLGDAPLGPPVVVGRGGLPIELTEHTVLDPEAAAALGLPAGPHGLVPDPGDLVVVARRHDAVVGAATLRAGELGLVVAPAERGTGIGSRLLEVLERAVERQGLAVTGIDDDADEAVVAFLRARGQGLGLGLGFGPEAGDQV